MEIPLFYRGCSRVWKAFGNFCLRYGEEASRLAARETNPLRRAELETIASDCTYISSYPPVNFRQAVQAVWFSHILNTFEDHINANSVGRLDQILYPFFTLMILPGHRFFLLTVVCELMSKVCFQMLYNQFHMYQ